MAETAERSRRRVVERTGHEIFDRSGQCMGLVGGDLDRVAVVADRRREEPGRGLRVAFVGDLRVEDLPMLVDCPIHLAPGPGDLHVGLVQEPTVTDRLAAGPGRFDQQRREPLHPPEQRDVVDLDPTLSEQLLE